jgi:hypothetical protein
MSYTLKNRRAPGHPTGEGRKSLLWVDFDRRLKLEFHGSKAWLHARVAQISSISPLAMGIRYALSWMRKTRPNLENGFLEFDNNTLERAVKPVALGRKNWMFAGSQRGGPVIV